MPARTCGSDRRLVDHQVDLAGHQVLHRRRGAAIGHEGESACRSHSEIDADDMRTRCRADVPLEALSGLAFSQAISSFRSFAGMAFLPMIRRISSPPGDRLEIVPYIVRQLEGCAIHDVGTPVADDQRVAVGRRAATRPTPMLPPAPTNFRRSRAARGLPHPLGHDAGETSASPPRRTARPW